VKGAERDQPRPWEFLSLFSRPADRPDSFVSAKGKVIAVEKKVAEVNENVLEHGRVHILFFTILCVPLLTDFPP
jgi:hypothetical protein